jgi:hypothetical protein
VLEKRPNPTLLQTRGPTRYYSMSRLLWSSLASSILYYVLSWALLLASGPPVSVWIPSQPVRSLVPARTSSASKGRVAIRKREKSQERAGRGPGEEEGLLCDGKRTRERSKGATVRGDLGGWSRSMSTSDGDEKRMLGMGAGVYGKHWKGEVVKGLDR